MELIGRSIPERWNAEGPGSQALVDTLILGGPGKGVSDNGKEAARSGVPCTHQSRMEFVVFS